MRIASRAARMPRRVPVYSKAQRAHATHSPSHGLHGPAVDWDARGCHGRSSARPCRSWEELGRTGRAGRAGQGSALTTTHYHSLPLATTRYYSLPLTTTHYHSPPVRHSLPLTTTHYHSLPLATTHSHSLPQELGRTPCRSWEVLGRAVMGGARPCRSWEELGAMQAMGGARPCRPYMPWEAC